MQDASSLAKTYYTQIVERGATHTKALCVVAAALAERAWAVLRRGIPYIIRDTDSTPVDPARAKAIIAERWEATFPTSHPHALSDPSARRLLDSPSPTGIQPSSTPALLARGR